MRMTRTASLPFPAAAPFGTDADCGRLGEVLRGFWLRLISLPDRGSTAPPDEVLDAFYRFPWL
jgi:hypothetical protein